MSDNLPPLLDFHTYCLLPCISSHPISPSISLASNRHAPSECWANKPGGTGGGGLGMLERSVFPKAFSGLSKRSRRVKNGSGMSSFVGQFGCTPRVGASIPEWARVTPQNEPVAFQPKSSESFLFISPFANGFEDTGILWEFWNPSMDLPTPKSTSSSHHQAKQKNPSVLGPATLMKIDIFIQIIAKGLFVGSLQCSCRAGIQ